MRRDLVMAWQVELAHRLTVVARKLLLKLFLKTIF